MEKLKAFWHIFALNNWKDVVKEQWDLFRASDLNPIASILGTKEDLNWVKSLGVNVVYHSENLRDYETPTLKLLWNWCKENPNGKVLYSNTKGVGKPDDLNRQFARMIMNYYVIWNWERNLKYLDEVDVVGVSFVNNFVLNGKKRPYFPGNFWMANSSWINKLQDPEKYRNNGPADNLFWEGKHAELWIGSEPGIRYVARYDCIIQENSPQIMSIMNEERYESILNKILDAGSENLEGFGGKFVGGYRIQQVPEELAEVLFHLEGKYFENFLEVGSAAGGTARIMREILRIKNVYVIDDNRLPMHIYRKDNLPDAIEFVGNSHSEECKRWLDNLGIKFDLVFIDAEHHYNDVAEDLRLVHDYLKDGSYVLFHDIFVEYSDKDVRDLWAEIKEGKWKNIRPLFEIGNKLGIGVCKFKEE